MPRTDNDTWDLATSVGATAAQVVHTAAQRWYDHGLDARIDDPWYGGERHDVPDCPAKHGWQTTRVLAAQLLADAGLPVPRPNDDGTEIHYCTATLGAR